MPASAIEVSGLVARFAHAVTSADPAAAAAAELDSLSGDIEALAEALSYLPGTGGNPRQAFYRAPNLSLLKVSFPAGRRTPPHNHGTWATILLLSGSEKNTIYRPGGGGELERLHEVVLAPRSIVTIAADNAHVAECLGQEPAIGLHVYGGNVLGLERRMWDPDTLIGQPLDWSLYEDLAERASKAASAP